jgi:hypothetical protein
MIYYNKGLLEEVKQYFGADKISDRYMNLRLSLCNYLAKLNMQDKTFIDDSLLENAIVDYFVDMYRLKMFHTDIKLASVKKIYGYTAFWLLRNKPIQLKSGFNNEERLYINEKVVMMMLLTNMIEESGCKPDQLSEGQEEYAADFAYELFYHFRYRVFTQQTIELALTMFASGFGICRHRIITNNLLK